MTGTTLTDSTSQVNLASYGTGNPFSVGSGVSIVNRHLGQTAIYGDATQAWTLTNAGTIGGGKGSADSEHSIGNAGGLGVQAAAVLTLTNSGRIVGGAGGTGYYIGGAGGTGVSMSAGGMLTNVAGATIAGGAGTAGLYDGGYGGKGVSADGFATITNQAGATIAGGAGGRGKEQGFGVPGAGGTGIVLTSGGRVSNAGTITGGRPGGGNKSSSPPSSVGVLFKGSANSTLTNSGVIAGINGKAVQFAGGNDRLILFGGSVLSGGADGGSGRNVLELGSSPSPGTVHGLGTAITRFQRILVDTGARWLATDTKLTAATTLVVDGKLALAGAVTGSGTIDIGGQATVISKGTAAGAVTVAFAARRGELQIVDTAGFKAGISGFGAGDRIDIDNAAFKFGKGETLTFVENAAKTGGTLALKNGDNRLALHLFGQYVAQGFQLSGDGHGGTLIAYQSPVADATDHLATGGHG